MFKYRHAGQVVMLVLMGMLVFAASASNAASSSSSVGATVPSVVTIDPSGCLAGTANVTSFGVIPAGVKHVMSSPCVVAFSSSNDTAQLRLWQTDLGGDAMQPELVASQPLGSWSMNGPLPVSSGSSLVDAGSGSSPVVLGTGSSQPTSVAGPTGHGSALSFDGDDTAIAPYRAAWDVSTFTADLWFRTPSFASGFRNLANRGSAVSWNSRQFSLEIDGTCGCFKANTSTSGSNRQIQYSSSGYLDNNWHYVVYTVDASKVQRLYLDGALVQTGAAMPGTIDLPAEPMRIGHQYSPASNFMTGAIDDVRLFSGVATPEQIATSYQQRIPDYDGGSASWDTGEVAFGACLNGIGGGLSYVDGTTWATGPCTAVDSTTWHGIPATSGDVSALIARRTTGTAADATVQLKYGFNVALGVQPGAYLAPVTFEAIAPG